MTTIRVTLPPHLRERIRAVLEHVQLPHELQGLNAALNQVRVEPEETTIDEEVLTRLARWAETVEGKVTLKRSGLDPAEYGFIALFAGTQVYLPAKQVELLQDKPNSFLPGYLAPKAPTFGQEYRETARQLSTALNILFSIVGSAAAVYVASVTGAGYSRETAVVLAILAGVVVGIADGVLVWIVSDRANKARQEMDHLRLEASKGSGAVEEQERDEKVIQPQVKGEVRLRRRALPGKER
ncbi:hypothetical protein BCR39DRAFT_520390 [Naematelia encephala]|uniref:Endoplasmic reticulum-based factor for assembly of V-ATPase-domain-containing protein n=1 Tax=Naematelia encephala TaxID=71784 RepID=A0A1Y2BFA4_9TREE|nr:hypothetical protein BCR39DRAFT_520390 [Naematelia encephala]